MKKHLLTCLCLLTAASFSAPAATTKLNFPSQEDFDANWVVDTPNNKGEWKWYDADNFADTPTLRWCRAEQGERSVKQSPIIRTKDPITVNPGKGYIYCTTKTTNSNDDHVYWLYVSDDPDFKTVTKTVLNGFLRYGTSYSKNPTSESDAEVTFEEGKNYYIGIQATGYGSYTASNFFIINELTIVQYEDTPQAATSQSVTIHNETVDGYATISWKWPQKTMTGKDIDSRLGAKIYRCPDGQQSNNGILKDEYLIKTIDIAERDLSTAFTYDDNKANSGDKAVTTPGKYYYYVVPFNSVGSFEPTSNVSPVEAKWIGEDVKMGLLNNIYVEALGDKRVSVNFENNNLGKGTNGGYMDIAKMQYKITRTGATTGEKIIYLNVSEYGNTISYIDTDFTQLDKYTYNVKGVYNEDEANATNNANVKYNCYNYVVAGGSLTTPYKQDFSTSTALDLYTIQGSSGTYTWSLGPYATSPTHVKMSSSSSYTPVLITPPLSFEKGIYKVSFKAHKGSISQQGIAVMLGENAGSLEQLKTFTITRSYTNFNENQLDTYEVDFEIKAPQTAYIAFKQTVTGSFTIYLDDIVIEKTKVSPGTVTELNVTPAPGEDADNKALLSFKLPAVAKSGAELKEDDLKFAILEVKRSYFGETKTGTPQVETKSVDISTKAYGEQMVYPDVAPAAGFCQYALVVNADNGMASDTIKSDVLWVGYDIPNAVTGLSADSVAGRVGFILKWTWDKSYTTKSYAKNGGYIDEENLRFIIGRSDLEEPLDTIAPVEGTAQTYTDLSLNDPSAVWDEYKYTVTVLNKDKKSAVQTTSGMTGGYAMTESTIVLDMTDDASDDLWDSQTFQIYDRDKALRSISNGSFTYTPPFVLSDPAMLGSVLNLEYYRAADEAGDADYAVDGEEFEVWLYGLDGDESATPLTVLRPRSKKMFPAVYSAEKIATVGVQALKAAPDAAEFEFIAPAAGRYRLGLLCTSKQVNGLYITKFDLKLGVTESIKKPAAVTDLKVTPGAEGANNATIEFTMPTLTVGGSALSELSGVEILRAPADSATFSLVRTVPSGQCLLGEPYIFTDNNIRTAAFYKYCVVAVLDTVRSDSVISDPVWIGLDEPKPLTGVKAEVKGDEVVITWDPADTVAGVHGGYINPARITYTVIRSDSENALAKGIKEETYTDASIKDCPWDTYVYSVAAVNGTVQGVPVEAPAVQAGNEEIEKPGGENPGGDNPGGDNPGGDNPGENPGGEEDDPGTEGITDAAIADGSYDAASGVLTLPEGALGARVFALSGMMVAAVEGAPTLDLSTLPSGVYIVQIVLADGSAQVTKLAK